MLIYSCASIRGSLCAGVFPDYVRLKANPATDDPDQICKNLACDAWLYHFDLTFCENIPLCRMALDAALLKAGVRIFNRGALDISKRHTQRCCAKRGYHHLAAGRCGDGDEMLIVKSDFNFGGLREIRFGKKFPSIPIRLPKIIIDGKYPLYKRRDIPALWWSAPELHIEKFITNRNNVHHRAYFFEDRVIISKLIDPAVLKKSLEERRGGITRIKSLRRSVSLTMSFPLRKRLASILAQWTSWKTTIVTCSSVM